MKKFIFRMFICDKGLKTSLQKLLICVILLSFITSLSGCFLLPKQEVEVLAPHLKAPAKVTYDCLEIKKSTFEKKIQINGNFVSVNQKDVKFINQSGRMKTLYIKSGDEVKKGTLIAELVTYDLVTRIKLQEISLKKQQKLHDMSVASGDSKDEIELKDFDLEAEKIRLDELKNELTQSKLFSPIDGTVINVTDAKEGDNIDSYSTIATIADPKDLQIQSSDERIREFKFGSKVIVNVNNVNYSGKVVMLPNLIPQSLYSDGNSGKFIRIKLDKLPPEAEISDPAEITLIQSRKDNVIVVRKSLVHTIPLAVGLRRFLYVLKNGQRTELDVETGEENDTEIIIVKGLSEGDMLLND